MKGSISLFFLTVLIISCSSDLKSYRVNETNIPINLETGLNNIKQWETAKIITKFSNPWENKIPEKTVFKAIHNDTILNCIFIVSDSTLVVNDSINGDENLIAKEDRVEIYFSRDPEMREYYCIEIDSMGKILDYKASYYRKFDNLWDIPIVKSKGIINSNGYLIELIIPIKVLNKLGIINNGYFYAGVYRADLKYSKDSVLMESWATWINPNTENPDFHVPATLGVFNLGDFNQ